MAVRRVGNHCVSAVAIRKPSHLARPVLAKRTKSTNVNGSVDRVEYLWVEGVPGLLMRERNLNWCVVCR